MTDDLRVVQPVVEIDNEHTRTVRWTLEPGTSIGHHRHQLPYIVVPIVAGTLTLRGVARGDRIEGEASAAGGGAQRWTALRAQN